MTRTEWISILAQARRDVLAGLAAGLAAAGRVEVIRPPSPGLLLATVQESAAAGCFHPGEVLVTTCEVRLDGALGSSVILGFDEDKARHCAVLDAALQAGCPESGAILQALRDARGALASAHRAEHEMVDATRVRFDTMDPQRP